MPPAETHANDERCAAGDDGDVLHVAVGCLPNLKRLLGSGAEFDKIKEAWDMGILDCNKSGPTITICLHVRE